MSGAVNWVDKHEVLLLNATHFRPFWINGMTCSGVWGLSSAGGRRYSVRLEDKEKRLNVVHVIVGLNVGGAELMLRRLIETQRAQDKSMEHQVISLTTVGAIGKELQERGVTVTALGMRSPLQVPFVLWKLTRQLRRLRPDIVQTWMYHADFLGGLAARFAGIRNVVWRICTTDVAKGGSRLTVLLRWVCARLSHRVPHTILCVAEAARRVHLAVGYCEERVVVLPDGFDMERLQASVAGTTQLRQACGFGPDTVVVGTLGRFNRVKDQENFVRAAGLIALEYPSVRFLMVGRGCDSANPALMNWIASTGGADRFVLLGERSDAPICLAAMDIFVLSSRTEGFPNVLGEAMAMGRLCVTTDVGDAALMLGEHGIVVPPEDAPALADGIAQMLTIPQQERCVLARRQHLHIEQNFSIERCARRFTAVYEDVLTKPRK